MLYIFGGFPRCGLNAGGLQECVERVEELALLEHAPTIQYRKEGVFAVAGLNGELVRPVEWRMSTTLTRAGIGWRWFGENWTFGNGVTIHKTTALMQGASHGVAARPEGILAYERRWRPGTCPHGPHVVHMTWLVTKHRLPDFAVARIRDLVESAAVTLPGRESYEPRHFSPTRTWRPA